MIASRATLFLLKPRLRPRAPPSCPLFSLRLSSNPIYKPRSFHTTPRPQYLEVCVDQVQSLITGLHSISGLPWAATLPLTALIVRSVIVGPLSVISHEAVRRRVALSPLLHAWQHAIRQKVMKKAEDLGPVVCTREIKRAMTRKTRELYSSHECEDWKLFLPLLQIPAFLIVLESVRKMCDAHAGLLGLMFGRPRDPVKESGDDPLDGISQTAASVEHSLSQEGALWFPDLIAPDPLMVLPFLLSGSLLASIYLHSRALPGQTPTKWSRRLTNTLRIMALCIGPATLQVPSALLLYWISSIWVSMGQYFLLDWYHPYPVPITPCKPKAK